MKKVYILLLIVILLGGSALAFSVNYFIRVSKIVFLCIVLMFFIAGCTGQTAMAYTNCE